MYHAPIKIKYPLRKKNPLAIDIPKTIEELYGISLMAKEINKTKEDTNKEKGELINQLKETEKRFNDLFVFTQTKISQIIQEADCLIQQAKIKNEQAILVAKGELGVNAPVPKKGIDYFDGKNAESLNKSEIIAEILSNIVVPQPKKVDEEKIIKSVLTKIPKIKELKSDSLQQLVEKINSLNEEIEMKTIKGLKTLLGNLEATIRNAVSKIVLGGSVRGGGATNLDSPTSGAVNGANTQFTFAEIPKLLFIDSVAKYENVHYTRSGTTITITDGAPPVQNIRSLR